MALDGLARAGRAPLSERPAAVVVLGPTASGKTALAVGLARELGGEVVNFDSRQVYRGLDIGTGKPTAAERGSVPHHLFDCVAATGTFSAAELAAAALARCQEIHARGRVPILCGGTGLYLRALLIGLVPGPSRDAGIHARLSAIADRGGLPRLRRWLERVDPEWAARIGVRDRQRTLRGLDVWLQSRAPLGTLIATVPAWHFPFATVKLALEWPRDELYRRIERRVRVMLEQGWLAEVERLRQEPGFATSNAAKALGYRALLDHLAGRLTLEQAIEQIQRDTRHLAKRQLTWFRREPDVHWIPAADPAIALGIARGVVAPRLSGSPLLNPS